MTEHHKRALGSLEAVASITLQSTEWPRGDKGEIPCP
jgi:hypothetical protein